MKRRTSKSHPHRRKALAVTLLLVVTVAYLLGWSSLLTVKQVRVIGAPTSLQAQLIGESVHSGEKMARLETRAISNSLRKYTWLDHARIDRNWLKGLITIRVWTRTPIAAYQTHLIDRNGILFDLPSDQISHLPRIATSNISSAKLALDLLLKLPIDFRANVMTVRMEGARSAILVIKSSSQNPTRIITVIWGDSTDTELKIRVLNALLALAENGKVSTINVSAPHAPIVK